MGHKLQYQKKANVASILYTLRCPWTHERVFEHPSHSCNGMRYNILPLATCVSTMPLQKIPPSDNIIFFAEMDGQGALGGATFGFFQSFDLRLQSGL